MIGYMPEIYPDELVYSWFCRYYAHSGYPSYVTALEDLLWNRYSRVDMEFIGKLNEEAKNIIKSMYDINELIQDHTMFLQYARFVDAEKRHRAKDILLSGEENIHHILPFPTTSSGLVRYLRYCPVCSNIDREQHGETYWHRLHQMRNIIACPKHGCKLIDTEIEMAAKRSPRLWVAEAVIPRKCNFSVDHASKKEIQLADYAAKLMSAPILDDQSSVHLWLVSKLAGSEYISARGKSKYINKLFEDMCKFYGDTCNLGITKPHQLQKLFQGYTCNFYQIILVSMFLQIPVNDLVHRVLPEKSQTEQFDQKVLALKRTGLGSYRCAQELGCSPSTVTNCIKQKDKAFHDYSVRKGVKRMNWDAMDKEMLLTVQKVCEEMYMGKSGKPKRVTEYAVTKAMHWPDKRMVCLPRCRELVRTYHENIEKYWARECVWAYLQLQSEMGQKQIYWRQIREITNIKHDDFLRCKPYLIEYTDGLTAQKIAELL